MDGWIMVLAVAYEAADRNPASVTHTYADDPEDVEETCWLNEVEARAVLGQLDNSRWRAAYAIFATAGPRRGEVLGLQWDRVNVEEGTIQLGRTITKTVGGSIVYRGPKSEAGYRTIRLPDFAADALRQHAEVNGTANLHVFSNPLTGKHPYPDSFKKPLATACRRADVTVGLHPVGRTPMRWARLSVSRGVHQHGEDLSGGVQA
jgi:integrase